MSPDERLDELKRAAKDYIDKEKKILNAEHDFIDNILKKRGANKVDNANTNTASGIFVSSLLDFLGS
jgi:ferredoxin-thioredoxin reductase catalytic subunit